MEEKDYIITCETHVILTTETIDDIMCCALEGGITYWCGRAEVVGEYLGEWGHEQIARGGTLILHDIETDDTYELTLEKFLDGAKKAVEEGYWDGDPDSVDAEVADAIVQIAALGEITFG